jgi:hypothetical protein
MHPDDAAAFIIGELWERLSKTHKLRVVKWDQHCLPICSSCKKIRDDTDYWNQLDAYIHNHTDAQLSHGICPDCAEKLYPDLKIYDWRSSFKLKVIISTCKNFL